MAHQWRVKLFEAACLLPVRVLIAQAVPRGCSGHLYLLVCLSPLYTRKRFRSRTVCVFLYIRGWMSGSWGGGGLHFCLFSSDAGPLRSGWLQLGPLT